MIRPSSMSPEDMDRFAAMYRAGTKRADWREAFPGRGDGVFNGLITRMRLHRAPRPQKVRGLENNHPALLEGRTIFPSRVRDAASAPALLTTGGGSAKLGARVEKGAWRGMPIFMLTLEERATCPRSCLHWSTCMGAGMPWAWRTRHGPELEALLEAELADLQRRYPAGFVVRLHALGDFYSVAYLRLWAGWLDRFPALRVFGYTAWPGDTEIGAAVMALARTRWDRFAVRLSTRRPGPMRAVTLWEVPDGSESRKHIVVCPAQLWKTASCSTCALCWSPAARERTIAFIAHGR